MIEALVYLRYGLIGLIPVFILIGIYFGVKQILYKKYRKKVTTSLILIIAIPIVLVALNALLENLILNDIKDKVKEANSNRTEITINDEKTKLTIKDINDFVSNMEYNGHLRNRAFDLEPYKVTIKNKEDYSFTLYRNARDSSLFRIYTNEYNYESELSSVKTEIFTK
jgi:energy-coupling factor transporter transmembrane protein EcfT